MADKPKLAIYWSSSCGGCEIAVVNLHEHLLDVAAHFDLVFCPCLVDAKKKDVEALPDGSIAATLFNGAVRTEDNEEMARLLRSKSKLLIAYGSCAQGGGIPALSNLSSRSEHIDTIYLDCPSVDNPDGIVPRERTRVPEGVLELPRFFDRVRSLEQVVPVDYVIPGCPPESDQLWNVLQLFIRAEPLPPRGAVIGAGNSAVCDECRRERTEKKIDGFRRIWEFVPDRETCLLEQGLLCMGAATRSGCGGLCPEVNMPCIGCYGPPDGVYDQGAKMAATLGSILDIAPIRDLRDEERIYELVNAAIAAVPDLAGVACKFSLATRNRSNAVTEEVTTP